MKGCFAHKIVDLVCLRLLVSSHQKAPNGHCLWVAAKTMGKAWFTIWCWQQRCVVSVTNFRQFDWLDAGERFAGDTGIGLVSIPVSMHAGNTRWHCWACSKYDTQCDAGASVILWTRHKRSRHCTTWTLCEVPQNVFTVTYKWQYAHPYRETWLGKMVQWVWMNKVLVAQARVITMQPEELPRQFMLHCCTKVLYFQVELMP